jgi:thiol-disulfide isomerase/thioredoxin
MARHVFAVVAVLGVVLASCADEVPQDYGPPPRLLIASGIDAAGNLILSGTEQRQQKVAREVAKDGKKTTREMTVTYPVTVLKRQTVPLKDVTITDGSGKTLSLDQARERLKEPTPVLVAMLGQKVDPIYRKVLTRETLTFTFAWFPEFKELPRASAAGPARKGALAVGDKVPDFSVRTLDGKTTKLSELRADAGRTKTGVVVLSFWCSTCGSCRRVEHHLDKLAKDYAGQAAVFALDANAGETAERVTAFAKEKGLSLPIVLDPTGGTADVFGTEVTTTTVVIDGQGVLRYCGRFRQGDGTASAEEALKAVLAGREVAVKTTPHDG